MKELSKKLVVLSLFALVLALPVVALAQADPPNAPGGLVDLTGGGGINGFLETIINWILVFAGTLCVLFIIIGGYQYIISGANEEQASSGKKTLQNAVIGLIIVLISYSIVTIVFNFLTQTP